MANLNEFLKEKHSGLSPLMGEREKMETDEALTYDGLTLDKIHLVTNGDGTVFAVVVFKEAPNKFYFGGTVLTEIVQDIYKYYGSDFDEVIEVGDDNIKLEVSRRRSKKKNTFYYNWNIV